MIFNEFKEYVGVHDRVPGRNPNVFQRGEFLSGIFAGDVEDVTVAISENCETLIQDLLNIKRAEDGTKLKKRIKDKITGQSMEEFGHACDALDVMVCQFLREDFKKYLKGGDLLLGVGSGYVSDNLY